jgi:WXXGXW repeat (2 copies)
MRSMNWSRCIAPALLLMVLPLVSMAQVSIGVSVNIAPPELPVYDQPPIPGDGYVWTPGYWAWGADAQDYYWIPGTWVEAPQPEFLWTPGYWAAADGVFLFHEGYWGPHVGFYGGVNYGYGYGGNGYEGGYWQGGHMFYNRAVVNVGTTHITNVYNKTVINNVTVTRVSYNGGSGGVRAQPTAADQAASRDRHIEATSAQHQHEQTARSNPALRASTNHGVPPIAATSHPGNFSGAKPATAGHANETNRTGEGARTEEANRPPANAAMRANPEPRVSQPRPAAQPVAPRARENQPPVREIQPQVRENPAQAPAPAHENPARAPTPVEPRREPEHTQPVRPAPKPQQQPRPVEHPAEHAPEHPDEHEHH